MDDLICELLNEPIVQNDNSIVFTSRAVELIHMISEKCKDVPIVQKTQEQAEEYAKDLTAEQVYVDMIYKIANAPNRNLEDYEDEEADDEHTGAVQ